MELIQFVNHFILAWENQISEKLSVSFALKWFQIPVYKLSDEMVTVKLDNKVQKKPAQSWTIRIWETVE